MVSPSLVDSVTRVGDRSPAGHPQASGSFGFGPLTAHPQPSSSFASELPLHPAMHGHAASPSFSPSLSFAQPSPSARVKRLAFLSPQAESHRTPYLWDLYETPAAPAQKHQPNTRSLDLDLQHRLDDFHAAFPAQPMDKGTGMGVGSLELPPLERATTEQFQAVFSPAHAHYYSHHAGPVSDLSLHAEATGEPAVSECDRCWLEAAQCAACREAKQAQFLNGWPVDVDAHHYHNSGMNHALLEHANVHNHEMTPLLQPAQPHYSFESDAIPMPPIQSELPARSFEEEKTAAMPLPPMVAAPAPGVGQGYEALARVQGKLARFLGPDGEAEGESDGGVCPPLELPSPMMTAAPSVGGRSMRVRKIRSRSPSLELSDSEDSGRSTPTHFHAESDLDDSISPPPAANAVPATHARNAMVEGSDDSGQSSAEPPLPTSLLPVSASALLPSRPSTAAIPPAHIKDRLVKSAKKLLTAADGVDTAVQVQVIPIFFPSKGASGAHKIRLIRVFNTDTQRVSVYAHAADVGGVVERKSNISRLFGKFESPSEKLLMNVVGSHNHTVGQESNILTSRGVRKFLSTNKMKAEPAYRDWINSVLLPKLLADPLVIGEELVEIEASTDPNAPHTIKPVKMRRMEKKQAQKRKEAQMQAEAAGAAAAPASASASAKLPAPSASDFGHVSKRQKVFHSPVITAAASPSAPLTPKLMAASSHQSHAA